MPKTMPTFYLACLIWYSVSLKYIRIVIEGIKGFPAMDDWLSVDFRDSGEDSVLQLLEGGDADMFEKRSRHLAK